MCLYGGFRVAFGRWASYYRRSRDRLTVLRYGRPSVHRFGRSRIVSAPPAARTDHGPFMARTPARPEGATFGAVGKDFPAAPYFLHTAGRSGQVRLARVCDARVRQDVHKRWLSAREGSFQ